MEIFEVHITGDESILNHAEVKTISIDLLRPDKSILRTEHMTSHVCKFENFNKCKSYVDQVTKKLLDSGTNIVRVKVECPYYKHYVDQSLYIESHFVDNGFKYPSSKNKNKHSILATKREYDHSKYEAFTKKSKNEIIELCLYDTNVQEDKDWFDLYVQDNENIK